VAVSLVAVTSAHVTLVASPIFFLQEYSNLVHKKITGPWISGFNAGRVLVDRRQSVSSPPYTASPPTPRYGVFGAAVASGFIVGNGTQRI
jgi:hypothetical protein